MVAWLVRQETDQRQAELFLETGGVTGLRLSPAGKADEAVGGGVDVHVGGGGGVSEVFEVGFRSPLKAVGLEVVGL